MNIGRRTFLVVIFEITLCIGFLIGKIDGAQFIAISGPAIGFYFGGRKGAEK